MKSLLTALAIISLGAAIVSADGIISLPRIADKEVSKIEVGSSPKVTIKFVNTTAASVSLQAIELYFDYSPQLIDNIIEIRNEAPVNFIEKEKDYLTPGQVSYKLSFLAAKNKLLTVGPGVTVDLASIIFHVNQKAPLTLAPVQFFTFSKLFTSKVLDTNNLEVQGKGVKIGAANLIAAEAPHFSGASKADSVNNLGFQNIGNTLLVNWISPGSGAADASRYANNKLSYRIYRSTDATFTSPTELSIEPDHSSDQNPDQRLPFTGNIKDKDYVFQDGPGIGAPSDTDPLSDGTIYYYKVLAVDDTSPNPNVTANVTVLSAIPMDFTPPRNVTNLTATGSDQKVTLSWKNPDDTDLGGVVIVKNIGKPVGSGSLGTASYPDKHGPIYQEADEPFGQDNGKVILVSPQEDTSPALVPIQYEDYAGNGVTNYYKVFTYDRAIDGPPHEMGKNYSGGVMVNTVGVPPQPITNFLAVKGQSPGEVVFSWNNPPDNSCEGILVRYSTNDKLKAAAIADEKSAELLGAFPLTTGPGGTENIAVSLPPGYVYYFKAFAYNQAPELFDPADSKSFTARLFSQGTTTVLPFLAEKGEELYTYTYNFQKGINHFAVPFPATQVTNGDGQVIDLATWAKLVDAINSQAGANAVQTLGRWNEVAQKAEGIVDIDYLKTGTDRYTTTAGLSVDQPVIQGQPFEISVNRPFTFTLKNLKPQ